MWWENLEVRVRSVSHCLCKAHEHLLTTHLLFHLCELPSTPLKSQTATLNVLFCLQLKMVFKLRASAILVRYSFSQCLSHVYMLLNFCLMFSY